MSKGDSGPGEWMPANAAFRCDYVVSFVAVVVDYELSIPDADRLRSAACWRAASSSFPAFS